ncbi:MAG: DUF3630 family protein [Pseudoalteromonas spongiae]|uniref:DUF3630 family protein n=1 Tax=Pseudoalteromonas TaxID=53246 RepID=UPI000CF724D8|nr:MULTISPECIES: DUF3630 family protein [Pseudoalteromonas]TMO86019.1 DUF3630 domain-containing protein [Pseudoalteromonas spongiae]
MTSKALFSDHILITPVELPDDEEFELWASIYLHNDAISSLEFEQGADRHLMRFKFKNTSFNLNFEHYSQSIWINSDSQQDLELLPELYSSL